MSDVAAAPSAEKPSGLARIMILSTATVATALVSMALLVMSVVMPQMQGSLSATPDQIAWAVTLNIVASAVCTPPSGWLANRFGRRNVLIWCTFGFTVATALCGTAESLEMLVVFRVLQGAFGAPLNPLCNAAVLDAFPREQHAMATAVFGMGVMIGPMLGPAVGGILAELYDWRAGFFLMAGFSLLTLVGIWAFMRDDVRSPSSLDWTGFLSLSVAVICLQLVLDRGHRSDWFDAHNIIAMTAIGAGAMWVCVVHCSTARRPFINPAMLRDRNYLIGMACTLVFGCVSYSPMVLLPPMLHSVGGYPDNLIGWVLSSRGVGAFLGFFVSIGIGKFDPRIGMALGFLFFAGSGLIMTLLDVNFQFWHLLVTSLMQGAAAGMVWVPMMVIAFGTLDRRWLNEAVALLHLFRYLGTSLFVSIGVTLILRGTNLGRSRLAESVSPYNEIFLFDRLTGLYGMNTLTDTAVLAREIDRQALMLGYLHTFTIYTVMCLATVLLVLLVRVPKKPRG